MGLDRRDSRGGKNAQSAWTSPIKQGSRDIENLAIYRDPYFLPPRSDFEMLRPEALYVARPIDHAECYFEWQQRESKPGLLLDDVDTKFS